MSLAVTPVILTLDEAPNLGRLLARLAWAEEVLVVDSGSTDGTVEIAAAHTNVRLVHHPFEHHARQWRFAVEEAGVRTPWVLALDADHLPDDTFLDALAALPQDPPHAAYRAAFTYCVAGRPLRGSLYPPREVLLHRARIRFRQRGHAQAVEACGPVGTLPGRILHDDRKPLERWLRSQWCYARLEAERVRASSFRELSWGGRARKLVLPAPPLAFLAALLARGGLLDGWAGLHYATERALAEALISLALIRQRLAAGE